MIGKEVTKFDFAAAAGEVALQLKINYDRAVAIKEFLDRFGAAGLITLGFTQGEADIFVSAFADLAYQKVSAFDSSQPVKQLYGVGF